MSTASASATRDHHLIAQLIAVANTDETLEHDGNLYRVSMARRSDGAVQITLIPAKAPT